MNFEKMTKDELIDYINNLNEEQSGKYGLIWDKEKVQEQIVVDCDRYIPILNEISKKHIVNCGQDNILIEGDNFHSLSVLNYTHRESIDIIYIDPPYNTGNKDFMYNDRYVDGEDGYRHSKWLNFMEKRLKLARNLLKEDGLIFISIDDNELYQLKLLCDKIFNSNNFVANIALEMSKTQGMKVKAAQNGQIVKNHEYVLVYAKDVNYNTNRKPLYDVSDAYDTHFNKVIIKENNKLKIYDISDYIKKNDPEIFSLFDKYDLLKSNKISTSNIGKAIMISDKIKDYFYNRISDFIYQEMACSISLPKDVKQELNNNDVIEYDKYLLTLSSGNKLRQYRNLRENLQINDEYNSDYSRVTIRGALWKGFYSDMMNISKEGNVEFLNGKKPVRLIKQIIKYCNRKNAIVLDFFAGSGTTGQAVLELNQEDNGKRKFILCTNNENNICEDVTYKRLSNVINGYDTKKGLKCSLKYFKTDFVNYAGTRDQLYYDLTEKCIPMLCIKSDTYILVEKDKEYEIYMNKEKTEYSCVYFDIFGESYDKFINKVKNIKEHKNLYIFSLSEYVNEDIFKGITNYSIEPIPYKILDLYKNVVKMSKEN